MKKAGLVFLIISFAFCNNRKAETITTTDSVSAKADTLQGSASAEAFGNETTKTVVTKDTVAIPKTRSKPIRDPSGIYQGLLPYDDSSKVEQTIRFYNNHTYRLQEQFRPNKKDSIIITEGTWTPSDGFIWLYKEQLAYGRYKWKGDTLLYFNPKYNKTYAMNKLTDVLDNKVWKNKKAEGILLFGIGNEPFWSIEVNNRDTISFLLSEWKNPVKMKLEQTRTAEDSTIYTAQTDSATIKLIVLPYFCNDGMSDNVYQNKVLVQYNKQMYSGCGVLYK